MKKVLLLVASVLTLLLTSCDDSSSNDTASGGTVTIKGTCYSDDVADGTESVTLIAGIFAHGADTEDAEPLASTQLLFRQMTVR